MKMHMEFINVHPFDVTFLSGLVLAMEQNKEKISTIRAVKVALMGPLGGIGDALFWLTLLPICAGIGASLALRAACSGRSSSCCCSTCSTSACASGWRTTAIRPVPARWRC